jgi:hypothetical protein
MLEIHAPQRHCGAVCCAPDMEDKDMHKTRLIALSFAATTLIATSAGAASADPVNAKDALPLQITCDNGHTYTAVGNGNGNFTPAHDLDSNAILIPVAFGEITFTVTDPSGTVVDQETQPPTSKGNSAMNPNVTINCSFSGGATAPDGFTFTIAGTVAGLVTPAR